MSHEIAAHPRRHTRFDARMFNITGTVCDRSDSVLKDISMGGACCLLKNHIEVNSTCLVRIDDGGYRFDVKGKVAWLRKPGECREILESRDGMYTIGVVFVNTYNTESGENLKRLIEKLDKSAGFAA